MNAILSLRLPFKLLLWRSNVWHLLALAVCACAGISWEGLAIVTQERTRTVNIASQRSLIMQTQLVRDVASSTTAASNQRLHDFYDLLGEKNYAEQQIKTLFAIAKKLGLQIERGQYSLQALPESRFFIYSAVIPVTGNYGALRQFCQQALLSAPFSSLDQLVLRREKLSENTVQAQLHFSFYLAQDTLQSP